ncbi:hypothetical protein Leryth_027327 [Lithospermum erythrorhizon]|nr:hypothetical protein Leryth_027327 [Lithospermum erythrorhizon]
MVSSDKADKDQNRGIGSMSTTLVSSKLSQDVGENSLKSIQLKDQFTPKVRKPYMITKQRERWTEDEHQKFIEALKLYGRAWKQIEELVATKTAVQIRSHAQKFFSKVVRDSSSGEVNSVKTVEIPPPRPKRKPVHPYPRKLNASSQRIDPTAEKPERSASMSPCLSVLEHGHQSPTSVLSAVYTSEESTPVKSVSPVSSATDVHYGDGSIHSTFPNRSSDRSSPTCEEEAATKILLISHDDVLSREDSVHTSSSRCLKLFGKTLIVGDSHKESMLAVDICKPEMINATDRSLVETLTWNMIPAMYCPTGLKCSLDVNSCSAYASPSTPAYLTSFQKDSSGYVETPLPLWNLSEPPFTSLQVCSPIAIKPCTILDSREAQDGDFKKEGSSSGSNIESICIEGDEDRTSSCKELPLIRQRAHEYYPLRSSKTGMLKHRTSRMGFVPYKRCLADSGSHSSMIYEQMGMRIRLSL